MIPNQQFSCYEANFLPANFLERLSTNVFQIHYKSDVPQIGAAKINFSNFFKIFDHSSRTIFVARYNPDNFPDKN